MASQGHVLAKQWIAERGSRPKAISSILATAGHRARPTNLIERSLKP
jgi:hypothetical protein